MIISLTRTNCFDIIIDSYNNIWKKHDLSQDSWIFVSPIKIPKKKYILVVGCDNRLAYDLNINYNLSNPTNYIIAYHYQKK